MRIILRSVTIIIYKHFTLVIKAHNDYEVGIYFNFANTISFNVNNNYELRIVINYYNNYMERNQRSYFYQLYSCNKYVRDDCCSNNNKSLHENCASVQLQQAYSVKPRTVTTTVNRVNK